MNPREKKFCLSSEDIKELIPRMGGCLATDRILVDGEKVGFMYREDSTESVASGWIFMAGDEDQEYVDDTDHWAIYEVNTVCNYDPTIIPLLQSPEGSAFGRSKGKEEFIPEGMPVDPDEKKAESDAGSKDG